MIIRKINGCFQGYNVRTNNDVMQSLLRLLIGMIYML